MLVPENGVVVKHIKTGEEIVVSRRVVDVFLLMTMADFSDQLFGFQDELFCNEDGRLEFRGNNVKALWPGYGKPGLWMNSSSRMDAVYSLIVREEEVLMEQRKRDSGGSGVVVRKERDEDIELMVPPVFSFCTKKLIMHEELDDQKKVACTKLILHKDNGHLDMEHLEHQYRWDQGHPLGEGRPRNVGTEEEREGESP
ncbi:hypothetical protein Bca4012_012297 [Brassica carinata]